MVLLADAAVAGSHHLGDERGLAALLAQWPVVYQADLVGPVGMKDAAPLALDARRGSSASPAIDGEHDAASSHSSSHCFLSSLIELDPECHPPTAAIQ